MRVHPIPATTLLLLSSFQNRSPKVNTGNKYCAASWLTAEHSYFQHNLWSLFNLYNSLLGDQALAVTACDSRKVSFELTAVYCLYILVLFYDSSASTWWVCEVRSTIAHRSSTLSSEDSRVSVSQVVSQQAWYSCQYALLALLGKSKANLQMHRSRHCSIHILLLGADVQQYSRNTIIVGFLCTREQDILASANFNNSL